MAGAGDPLAFTDKPGTSVTLREAISGTPDVTLYAVVDIIDTVAAYSTYGALYSPDDVMLMKFQTGAAAETRLGYRVNTSAQSNATGYSPSSRTPGRHIAWVVVKNGMTAREFAVDQVSVQAAGELLPGDGWTASRLLLNGATASTAPVAVMIYSGAHDEKMRARMLEFLADKYEVPPLF